MMIDFEDRVPAPTLSWGERLLAVPVIAFTIYGLIANGVTILGWIKRLVF